MPQVTINYLAVLIAGVINMAIGMFWYSPALFAKPWLVALGKTPEDIKQSSAGPIYVINTVASLVTAYVLAMFIKMLNETTAIGGAKIGVWVWLGFVVMTVLPTYLYEMRPRKLYFIYISYQLISFIIMGIVLAIWV